MAVRLLRDADHRGWPSPFAEVVEVAEDAAHAGRRSLLAHYPRVPGSLKEGEGRGYIYAQPEQPEEEFMLTSVAGPAPQHSSLSSGPLMGGDEVSRGAGGSPAQQSHQGKAAGTGGEEGEEEDGSGPDPAAYWQDLPPGVYSMKLACAAAAARGNLVDAAGEVRSEAGRGDREAAAEGREEDQLDGSGLSAGVPWQQLPWGTEIRRHAWTDPLLRRLEGYARAEGGGGTGTGGSSSSCVISSMNGMEIHTSLDMPATKATISGAEYGVMATTGQPHWTASTSALAPGGNDADDEVSGAAASRSTALLSRAPGATEADEASVRSLSSLPRALGACWDPESAVEAVLMALQAAVEVSADLLV